MISEYWPYVKLSLFFGKLIVMFVRLWIWGNEPKT